MGQKIKYLGSADKRVLPKGTDWGGQLAEPTEDEVVFSHDNHFIVDAEEAGLSDEALELLLDDPDFRDVSDLKTIPLSVSEQRVRGAQSRVDAEDVPQMRTAEKRSGNKSTSGGTRSASATTTGGSTGSSTTSASTEGGS